MRHLLSFVFTACLFPTLALACPKKDGIPDWNCDGKVQITIIGDSIASGFGDTKNGNKGGYILRASRKLADVTFVNLAKRGMRTFELVSVTNKYFSAHLRYSPIGDKIAQSDVVVLDVGRNDRWLFGEPIAAYRNLKRAASIIEDKSIERTGSSPLIVTSVLMLPNRGSQGPWVKALNEIILRGSSLKNPADLRFDLVSKRLLSEDQIHPTPQGYDALSQTLITYLTKSIPSKMKNLRVDTDHDGIEDLFETAKFGTLIDNPDSDNDGIGDGDEIFVSKTDPLVAEPPLS